MAKQSGIGANLYVGAYDVSGDVGAIQTISSPRGSLAMTGIDKPAEERILTLRDGNLGFTGFWNTATGQLFDALSAMPTTDVLCSVVIPTDGALAIGSVGCGLNGKQITFDQEHGDDGSLGVTTEVHANGSALEWGRLLTAGKASVATGTVNQTGIDDGASSSFGWAAYLHVMAMASGTMTAKLQESDDDISYSDLSGGGFTNVTGPTSQRIVGGTTAAVKQYIRLATGGTHGTATMAVLFVRYLTSQAI